MAKIELRDVFLEYEDDGERFPALEDINLTIGQGEFVCVIGPSGCGKSTMISLLEGLIFPTRGKATIDGQEIRGPGKDRCVVFQHYSLFAWFTARQNVSFGIKQVAKGLSPKDIDEMSMDALEKVRLRDYADKYPHQLSGGMQQRVAIARGLAMDPQILLMDEPFGAIDTKNRIDLQYLLLSLCANEKRKKTVVFVTHDVDEAIYLADRIIYMDPRVIREDIPVKRAPVRSDPLRDRSKLFSSDEYRDLHRHLMGLFYRQIGNEIWKDVSL